jgi:hypothetical protein
LGRHWDGATLWNHHCTLKVETVENRGSSFIIQFPMQAQPYGG